MGNCCFKKLLEEPNQPVTKVHLSTGGKVLRVSTQPNISRTKSPNGNRIIRNKIISSSNSLIIQARINQHERDRRRLPVRPRNSHPSNTQMAKRREDKRRGKPINARDWTLKKVNKNKEGEPSSNASSKVRCFYYDVLRDATNNFSTRNLIGEGGFGDVYKGYFTHCTMNAAKQNEGFAVAIKRLVQQRPQGCEAWETEIQMLSQLNHANIVKLIGHCRECNHRMLVYEYMDKGSLDNSLFTANRKELNWCRRISIAVGIARGLAYLHANEMPIIHCDIKASNVLLDSKFNVKISDFGLAKYGPDNEHDHLSTTVNGTKGYFAPEYFKKGTGHYYLPRIQETGSEGCKWGQITRNGAGHLTVKADVYSFGVVLLEILTGSSVDKRCPKGVMGNLVERVKPLLCSNNLELHRIIDNKLRKNVPMEEAQRFARITNQCLSEEPERRPSMAEVVTSLEQLQQIVGGATTNHDAQRVSGFSACPPPPKKASRRKPCK